MSPLLWMSLLFFGGLLLGRHYPLPLTAGLWLVPLFALLFVDVSSIRPSIRRLSILCIAWVTGWWAPSISHDCPPSDIDIACHRMVEGRLLKPIEQQDDHWRITVDVEALSICLEGANVEALLPYRARLFATLYSTDRLSPVFHGDRVRLRGYVKPIVKRRNPGSIHIDSSMPGLSASLQNGALIAPLSSSPFRWRARFDRLRERFSNAFGAALPDEEASVARALSLGQTHSLSDSTSAIFRRAGVSHLLSVSGLHLGLVTLFAFGLCHLLLKRTPLARRCDVGRIAACSAILPAAAFALLTGLRPPVLRALMMALVILLGRAAGRQSKSMEPILLAALFMLANDPDLVVQPGFQLSFAAVIGLAVVFACRNAWAKAQMQLDAPAPRHRIVKYLHGAWLSSIIATAVTAPFVLVYFQMLPLFGVVINLVAVPLVGFAILPTLLFSMMTLAVSPTWFHWTVQCIEPLIGILIKLLSWISTLPLVIEYPSFPMVIGLCVSALAVLAICAKSYRIASAFGLVSALILLIAFLMPTSFRKKEWSMLFLDVGQGDSTLITTPDGKHLLIDTGIKTQNGYDAGASVVVPALNALGISQLDALVLTHPDADHVGGAASVLQSITVKAIWETGQGTDLGIEGGYGEAMKLANQRRIPVHRPPDLCGTHRFGEIQVSVIHPCNGASRYDSTQGTNENSLVLKMTYQNHSALFLGDVPADIETKLLEHPNLKPINILKIAHHGSRTSTSEELLDRLKPNIAVISVAPFNPFHMPHPSVLFRLRERRIRTLRTDVGGAVAVSSNGKRLVSHYYITQ